MSATRTAFLLLSLGWLSTLPAAAEDAPGLALPKPPEVAGTVEDATLDTRLPDEVRTRAVGVTIAESPTEDPALTDIPPPDVPAATVVVTPTDGLSGAIALRLAEGVAPGAARLPRKEREAIAAFYALGAFKPLWLQDGAFSPAARAVLARLQAAGDDALDAGDYGTPAPGRSVSDLAEADLKLSAAAVLYARDARGARIEPARLSTLITPKLELPAAAEVLTRLAAARDPGATLAAYNPTHAGYRALKRKLAELRGARPGRPAVEVPQGQALKLGMLDARVPLVRSRLDISPTQADETLFDERVAAAVTAFQKQKGLAANGVLTRQTVAAMGGPAPERLEAEVVANMERWRWLPSDLGRRHVFVNVPEFKLKVVDNGAVVHQTRVVVGKPDTPTPVFSDEMDHVVVNPSWYVPPSIFKNEFHSDPGYARARGYEVVRGKDGAVSIRQPPGERNALGFIKFMFPNQHAVYLHDTPSRSLFSAERRAFSHGCVRVDDPFRLVDHVFRPDEGWSEERMRALIGKGEKSIRLREKLAVHIAYFTASVDERGELKLIDDIYGHSRRVRVALGVTNEAPPTVAVAEKPKQKPRLAAAAPSREVRETRSDEDDAPPRDVARDRPAVEAAPPPRKVARVRPPVETAPRPPREFARARRPAEVAAAPPAVEFATARPAQNPIWWFLRGN